MKVEIYKSLDKQLQKQWFSLWKKSPYANYTNSPQWFLSVTETFGHSQYVCIAVYEKDELVAIGALIKKRKYNTAIYTIEPGDFVCGIPFLIDVTNRKVVKAFVKALLSLQVVLLDNVAEEFVAVLEKNTSAIDKIPQAPNYYLPILKDKEGKAIIEKRKDLMRRVKNIEEQFVLRVYDGTTPEGIEKVYEIDEKSHKQSGGYNTFASETTKEFFKNLAKYFQKNISFNILYFENSPIAFEIGFIAGKTYFGNQISFLAEYKQYSPGKVLVTRLIEYLASINIKIMDLGSGDAHIKRLIASDHRQFYHVVITNNKLLINYIKSRKFVKSYVYKQLQSHATIYSVYRKIKNIKN
jgi:CelD/BcsL family acetyltransferase involved in cellulose biosynthesis